MSCNQPKKRFIQLASSKTNISFVNELKPTPDLNILTYLYYYNGAGISAADFNNDGLIDLYFAANQTMDRLYMNKGGFVFEDITERANLSNEDGWTTGVTHVDINADGLLDIYICKVGHYKTLQGRNLLFVNQGIDSAGIPYFTEEALSYGLDIVGFSTQAVFLDYDLDEDLDMFLLNHSVHPNRSYGKGTKRQEKDPLAGDRLFRNDQGEFMDVTDGSGIFQGTIGYGLGVSAGDLNGDGYPDFYVGNDFFENDYLYLNQQDGTFREIISEDITRLGHTTHYSMGNTLADLNNDGMIDILSLDMLPEDIHTYKTSGSEALYPTYTYYLKNGYSPQYMQNTLHLNKGNGVFSEVAFLSGIAASEWSWGVLAADFDMDGLKDLYISNGIKGATNDMDFINFIAQEKIQKQINSGMTNRDMEFIDQLPEKKVSNYAFRNTGKATYENVTESWFEKAPSFSNGCIYADLDNDGDLDIVVNNTDQDASIYENLSNKKGRNFITIKLTGPRKNKFGIGAKVLVYAGPLFIIEENFPTRSYLSAVPPEMTIPVGARSKVDSLTVVWPGGKFQKLYNLKTNRQLTLDFAESKGNFYEQKPNTKQLLFNSPPLFDYSHLEEPCLDFDREPLVPFAKSNEGPQICVADINSDGLDDLFIGGAKRQPGALFFQEKGATFNQSQKALFGSHAINEDTDNLFFDVDNDGDMDLIVVSGGNEFTNGAPLKPRLYLNSGGMLSLKAGAFEGVELNASVVINLDIDNDGDQDIVIGANALPREYGKTAYNYIFENKGNLHFENITETYASSFSRIGLVEDIALADLDGNGYTDILVAGHWMPLSIFYNDGKKLVPGQSNLAHTNGWWNSLKVYDFDKDGDFDIVAGNWGLNTRLTASIKEPLNLYINDFDNNGDTEPVITYFYKGKETTLASKDELVKQMPFLNKKFLSYRDFANAGLNELFPGKKLKSATRKQVFELASCYFENRGDNSFEKHRLPIGAQVSTIHDMVISDFNEDGFMDLLLAGNTYEISTQLGRLDSSHGVILLNDSAGFFEEAEKQSFDIAGPARDIEVVQVDGHKYFIVAVNNGKPIFLTKN